MVVRQRAYKRIGGDLSDLDSLSEQAEMNRKVLVSNKTMIANISIDESYKKKIRLTGCP